MRVLVTGGAGYIGSHTLVELLLRDYKVHVIDNLCNSKKEILDEVKRITNKDFTFDLVDIRNASDLDRIFAIYKPEIVVHFAGLKSVEESSKNPLGYYDNNVNGSLQLLKTMDEHGCKKIVFSSTATVYGEPKYIPLDEDHPLQPSNPYGITKLAVENMISDWVEPGKSAIILRYFNPIGAHESGLIGEMPLGTPSNLFPYLLDVAIGKRAELKIFGSDYQTRDGSAERDYINVCDLANAHVSAIESDCLNENCSVVNIGTGCGTTVKEVVQEFENILDIKIPRRIVEQREGDISRSVASPLRAKNLLNWEAKRSISDSITSSWKWINQSNFT